MQLHDGVMEFLPALAGNGADSALAFLDVPKRPGKRKSITPDSITFSQRYEQVRDACHEQHLHLPLMSPGMHTNHEARRVDGRAAVCLGTT